MWDHLRGSTATGLKFQQSSCGVGKKTCCTAELATFRPGFPKRHNYALFETRRLAELV